MNNFNLKLIFLIMCLFFSILCYSGCDLLDSSIKGDSQGKDSNDLFNWVREENIKQRLGREFLVEGELKENLTAKEIKKLVSEIVDEGMPKPPEIEIQKKSKSNDEKIKTGEQEQRTQNSTFGLSDIYKNVITQFILVEHKAQIQKAEQKLLNFLMIFFHFFLLSVAIFGFDYFYKRFAKVSQVLNDLSYKINDVNAVSTQRSQNLRNEFDKLKSDLIKVENTISEIKISPIQNNRSSSENSSTNFNIKEPLPTQIDKYFSTLDTKSDLTEEIILDNLNETKEMSLYKIEVKGNSGKYFINSYNSKARNFLSNFELYIQPYCVCEVNYSKIYKEIITEEAGILEKKHNKWFITKKIKAKLIEG